MIIAAIPLSVRPPIASPSKLALRELREGDEESQGSSQAERIPPLQGSEIHGFATYSNFSYLDIQQKLSERLISPKQSLAILMNPSIYRRKQDYYVPNPTGDLSEKFLLNKEELETSVPWNSVTGNRRKVLIKGKYHMYEYTSDDKLYFRRTLISVDGDEESAYHFVQKVPKKKKRRLTLDDDSDAPTRRTRSKQNSDATIDEENLFY